MDGDLRHATVYEKAKTVSGEHRPLSIGQFRTPRRFYWDDYEMYPPYVASSRALHQFSSPSQETLGNPLVIASIVAGVLGVLIIAVIILGMWFKSKFPANAESSSQQPDVDSTVIMSSLSTLHEGNENETMETVALDDTTTYFSAQDFDMNDSKITEFNASKSSGTVLETEDSIVISAIEVDSEPETNKFKKDVQINME